MALLQRIASVLRPWHGARLNERVTDVVMEGVFDADDATVDRLGAATVRYCMAGQSLPPAPTFVVRRA